MSRRKQRKDTDQIVEHFTFEIVEGHDGDALEEGSSLVRGVKLLGLTSKNGRNYDTHGVRSTAIEHLNGARVFVNHPAQPSDSRRYEDQIGSVESAKYVSGKGFYGDVRFNPKHPVYEQLNWDIRNNPKGLGMSINATLSVARQRDNQGRLVVEGIRSIRSVDLVTHPATTDGVFEHEETDVPELTTEELLEQVRQNPEVLEQLQKSQEDESKQAEIQAALESAQAELAQLKSERDAEIRLKQVTEQVAELLKDSALSGLSDQVVEHVVQIPAESAASVILLLESVVKAVADLPVAKKQDVVPQLGSGGSQRGGDFDIRRVLGRK